MPKLSLIKEVKIHKVDLKALCEKANISLPELARLAEVNYAHLNRISLGYHSMSLAYWNKLRNALDKQKLKQKNAQNKNHKNPQPKN